MSFYVFALVDEPPSGKPGAGLSGPLSLRRLTAGYAVVERRADVPPVEFGTLQRHQAIVGDLAGRVPAILPVRFGTLLDVGELDEALLERGDDLVEAFDAVRGRVQFTWRKRDRSARGAAAARRGLGPAGAIGGAEYLRRAARAAKGNPPASWRAVRSKLSALIAAERYQPATAAAPESLYHLVDRVTLDRYSTTPAAVRGAAPALTMTGPWPPFAFVPEIL